MDTDISSPNCSSDLKRKDAVKSSQTFSGPELNHHISAYSPPPNANTYAGFRWS